MQGGLSRICDEGEQEEKGEDGRRDRQCLFILDFFHGGGVWRDWVHSVTPNNACAGLSDSESSQLKTIQGTVTEHARDLGESSNTGIKTPNLVVLWQHYPLEHDG